MSAEIVEFLEALGFVDEARVGAQIRSLPRAEFRDFNKVLSGILRLNPSSSHPAGMFNFLTSANLRGDKCCTIPECRLSGIDELSRFAALYADKLFLPLLLSTDEDVRHGKQLLEGSLRIALAVRPLIEAGIVVPISVSPSLCVDCDARLGPVYDHAFGNAQLLMRTHRSEFRAKALRRRLRKTESLEIHVEGPPQFLPDGGAVFISSSIPEWAAQFKPNHWMPVQGPLEEISPALRGVFEPSAKDFVLHNVMGRHLGATYLTNLKGEAEFFAIGSADGELSSRRIEAFTSLRHTLPVFDGLDLNSLIRLRSDEPESFRNYRNALTIAVTECERAAIEDQEVKDVFQDILRPQLQALQARDEAEKANRRKRLATRIGLGAIGGLAASVGALMSGMPMALGGIISAAVTCLNPSASEDLVGSFSSSTEVKSNSVYFLLEANRRDN